MPKILDLGPLLGCFQGNKGDFVLNEGYRWILRPAEVKIEHLSNSADLGCPKCLQFWT